MSIESATFISDLQPANPPSTDPRGQGDDHLRLIKQVLQNSLPNASRALWMPRTSAKSANFSIVAADQETTFYVTTTGGSVTATLPTGLVAGDSGWRIRFLKITSDANPIFVVPASGTLTSGGISGLGVARRCIPGIVIEVIWSGTAWFVSRALALPIGSMISYGGTSLPAGYEWPNGQTLSSIANYPEYNSAIGGLATLDLRGRVTVTLDNLGGSAAGRLAGGVITGTAVGNVGGADTVALTLAQLPTGITSRNASQSITVNASSSNQVWQGTTGSGIGAGAGPTVALIGGLTSQGNNDIGVTSNNTGGGAHPNVQPSIMVSKILVVE